MTWHVLRETAVMLTWVWPLLIPAAAFAIFLAWRAWSPRMIAVVYLGLIVPIAVWQLIAYERTALESIAWYAISLALVWLGFWLWRRPRGSLRAALRVIAIVVWAGIVVEMAWMPLLIACSHGDCP